MRSRFSCSALVVLALALAGCGGGDGEPAGKDEQLPAATAKVFAFDRAAQFAFQEDDEVQQGRIRVRGIHFASPGGDQVTAAVALPPEEPTAGVVYVHGSGGSWADFLPEALAVANRGGVGLALDSAFTRAEQRGEAVEEYAAHRKLLVQTVQDVQRSLDVLVSKYGADPGRLAVVGYSMGAQTAAIAAALEPRLKALVVMAGRARPSRNADFPQLAGPIRPLDTVRYIGHVAPASILLQAGRKDALVDPADMEALAAAASTPNELRWYDAGHELAGADGERLEWLSDRLGLR
jgi:dienelactone hydrolase